MIKKYAFCISFQNVSFSKFADDKTYMHFA